MRIEGVNEGGWRRDNGNEGVKVKEEMHGVRGGEVLVEGAMTEIEEQDQQCN